MILQFIITVLITYGVKASTGSGMILEFIPITIIKYLTRYLKDETVFKIIKPLTDCTPCMASVYGTISFLLYFPDQSIINWVIWVFALSGFNYLLNKIIK